MSAKSDKNLFFTKKTTQNYHGSWVPNLILKYQALYITKYGFFWIDCNNFSSSDHCISVRLIEKVEEIKKNIKTWGCGTLRFRVMTLGKRGHKFLFSTGQIFFKKLLYHIVAIIGLKRTFPHSYATSFSIKTIFCKTNNIFYSLENPIWDKTKQWFWKYIKNKGKVTLESFRNFVYVSSYLHLKSFARKRDYIISQKLQMSQT